MTAIALPSASGLSFTYEEQALRLGRAFTVSTGMGTVAGGNHMVMLLTNPAGSGWLARITNRLFTASRADNLSPVGPPFMGLGNPTGNLPALVANFSNRSSGMASPLTSRYAVMSTANLPTGGTTAAGNIAGGGQFDLEFERTLAPGQSFANYMSNTSSVGLGGAFDILMCITFNLYLEPI